MEPVGLAQGVCFAATASCAGAMSAIAWLDVGGDRAVLWPVRRVALAAGTIAVVSHCAVLVGRAGEMLEKGVLAFSAQDTALIVGHTWFGQAWILQGSALVAAIAVFVVWRAPGAGAILGFASLAALPLSGHIIADASGTIAELANVLHVVLAGMWFGGVASLVTLHWVARTTTGDVLVPVLSRFSQFALPAMLLVLASGCVLSSVTVNRWAALFATRYGALLLLKLVTVACVLVAAAIIRQRLLPEAAVNGTTGLLVRALDIEFLLAAALVLLAGILSQTTPAAHSDLVWRLPFRFVPNVAWGKPGVPMRVLAAVAVSSLAAGFVVATRARRISRWAHAGAGVAILAGVGIALDAVAVGAYPTTYTVSPMGYDALAAASGRRLFLEHCVACHGLAGHGDGPAAAALKPAPADLTAPHIGDHTAGDMFWWISHGMSGSAMPAFDHQIGETGRWQLVVYLIALSHGYQSRVIKGEPIWRQPWLPAMDFALNFTPESQPTLLEPPGPASRLVIIGSDPVELAAQAEEFARSAERINAGHAEVVIVATGSLWDNPQWGRPLPGLQIVKDRDGQIAEAWSLYRRTFRNPDFKDENRVPSLIGYLVDRFGFVRARWRTDEHGKLPSPDALVSLTRSLALEPEIRSLDDHVH
jgi:putative copper export protein/mono/diheme cytochrome c family protein